MRKRIQNKWAESRFAFPIMGLYGILAWLAGGLLEQGTYVQFALFVVATLTMMTLNNSNALIRIYSRMVSCSFIVMTCAASFLFQHIESAVVQTMLAMFYLSITRSYQDKRAPGIVFYSFACIGIASFWFVQILYFLPVLWILMATNMMALSHKMFWASIIGVIAPYWFAAGYYAWQERLPELGDHFMELASFGQIADFSALGIHEIATFAVVTVLTIIGITHYMRSSYLDKIRTRMIFEMFITMDILTLIFAVLQPQHFYTLLPMMIVNTSCLFAHFIALTKTKWTNFVFILVCVVMAGLTAFNMFL